MSEIFTRTELLLGKEAMLKLNNSSVLLFGVGGVGGYVAESLARSGVGRIDLVDPDVIRPSNINRQIVATHSTLGKYKVDVARERILDIFPDCKVNVYKLFFLPETEELADLSGYDYVIDAIDTISAKIEIVRRADTARVPVISSMGAGNKTDPTAFRVADIYSTAVCPVAKTMRRELKKAGIKKLKVVYSEERPLSPYPPEEENAIADLGSKRAPIGSLSFVPSVAGLIISGEVIMGIAGINRTYNIR
ncbi:MAG: tRNA threonylcarbamoyladenosine dehydratase [Clostridia bacterium]|nr:tRNA threonylcarbamoyladenosine dehydratase [Clostridia bacterium]